MKKTTTLRELAKAAGVSVGTASQALRNDSNSSQATCQRIQELAKQLGYRPDPLLARLASKRFHRSRNRALAPVVFATHGNSRATSRGMRYCKELKQHLEAMGYGYRHVPIESQEQLRQGAKQWYHEGALGVIFGFFQEADWIQSVDWSDFSVLFLGGTCPVPLLHTVKADVTMGMEMVLDRVLERAEGRIGVVLHQHRFLLQDDRMREGLSRNFLAKLPSSRRAPLLLESFDSPMASQIRSFDQWLQRYNPDHVVGYPLVKYSLANREFSFFPVIQDFPAKHPGAVEPAAQEAQQAVEWIDKMIRHGETGIPRQPLSLMVMPEWSDGAGEV